MKGKMQGDPSLFPPLVKRTVGQGGVRMAPGTHEAGQGL